jgi:hypothetical protein
LKLHLKKAWASVRSWAVGLYERGEALAAEREMNDALSQALTDSHSARLRLNHDFTHTLLAVVIQAGGELDIPADFVEAAYDPEVTVDVSHGQDGSIRLVAVGVEGQGGDDGDAE